MTLRDPSDLQERTERLLWIAKWMLVLAGVTLTAAIVLLVLKATGTIA